MDKDMIRKSKGICLFTIELLQVPNKQMRIPLNIFGRSKSYNMVQVHMESVPFNAKPRKLQFSKPEYMLCIVHLHFPQGMVAPHCLKPDRAAISGQSHLYSTTAPFMPNGIPTKVARFPSCSPQGALSKRPRMCMPCARHDSERLIATWIASRLQRPLQPHRHNVSFGKTQQLRPSLLGSPNQVSDVQCMLSSQQTQH
jgi:hypothetical protein